MPLAEFNPFLRDDRCYRASSTVFTFFDGGTSYDHAVVLTHYYFRTPDKYVAISVTYKDLRLVDRQIFVSNTEIHGYDLPSRPADEFIAGYWKQLEMEREARAAARRDLAGVVSQVVAP